MQIMLGNKLIANAYEIKKKNQGRLTSKVLKTSFEKKVIYIGEQAECVLINKGQYHMLRYFTTRLGAKLGKVLLNCTQYSRDNIRSPGISTHIKCTTRGPIQRSKARTVE